jgi:hypothetical protein
MITGRRSSFEARCKQRGYTLDEVRPCIVSSDGDRITVDELHPSYPRPKPPPAPQGGPGTELKALLSKIGIKSSPTCSCNKRAKTMDENGVEWCEQNVETICDWLAEESAKRKLPFLRAAGKVIINMAIKRAKKHNSQ